MRSEDVNNLDPLQEAQDDPLARYIALEHERRELESRLSEIKAEAARLEDRILEDWANRGQTSAKIGGLLAYVTTEFWCSKKPGVDTQEVCRRLKAAGLGRLVAPAYNAQSLKAWIKEQVIWDDAGNQSYAIPEEIAEVVQWGETPRLKTRKA